MTGRALDDHARLTGGDRIRTRVLALPEVKPDATVLAYASIKTEVPTYALIEELLATGVRVALPVIESDRRMSSYIVHSLKELAPDTYDLLAPRADLRTEDRRVEAPDVVLVPGLGFDEQTGHRLGRGAGYYDRYLTKRPASWTAGLAFDEQVVIGLPTEAHDVPLRALITPARTLRFS